MKISYSLERKNSFLILAPKKEKDIQSKTQNDWGPLDSVRFNFTDLGKSRPIANKARPRKISLPKKIWYSYFYQRKVVWIRTSEEEIAINRKELSQHLGISKWELSKHLRKNNVVNPRLINASLLQAYSSAEKLDIELKRFIETAKKLKCQFGQSGMGDKKTRVIHEAFKESLEGMIETLSDQNINKDPYNKTLLETLLKMNKFIPNKNRDNTTQWRIKLEELRDDLERGTIWWELNIKWNKRQNWD